jgi:hypothetical protein
MAIKANLIIDQGTDYSTTINVTDDYDEPIDLSTYTGVSQIRKHYTSVTYYSFGVVCNSNGEVVLSMNAATSNTITAGRYVYDCELTDGTGKKSRLVEGIVTITPQVTR